MEENNNYMKPIEVEAIEILEDTPFETKLDYFYKLLYNNGVEKRNFNNDIKVIKKDVKEAEIDPSCLSLALTYFKGDGVNKTLEKGELIEEYLAKLKNGDHAFFKELDMKLSSSMDMAEEAKEGTKNLKDNISQTELEFKPLSSMATDDVKRDDPDTKDKAVDVVKEGTISDYRKVLSNKTSE